MKFLKNWKIDKKLMIAFLLVILISSLAGILGLICVIHVSSGYEATLIENGFAQGDIGEGLVLVGKIDKAVHDAVSFENLGVAEDAKESIEKHNKDLGEYIEMIWADVARPEEEELCKKADELWAKYYPLAQEIVKQGYGADQAGREKAQARIINELTPIFDDLYETLQAVMELNVEIGDQNEKALQTEVKIVIFVVLALLILSIVAAVFIGKAISSAIADSIKKCVKRLEQLAEGDFTTPVPLNDTKDETKQLTEATKTIVNTISNIVHDIDYMLGEMADGNFRIDSQHEECYVGDFAGILTASKKINRTLSSTLSQINQAADQVASGADQVSNGAQALSQGSTEQAASVEELSATITEMTNNIRKNADDAKNANNISLEAAAGVTESNQKMAEMIEAMDEIAGTSAEISKIIKAIDDIAFQTNILALNAAVEAARAGAAGKGFAVVADEVRNLAQKSADAAKNTSDLIAASVKAVERGSKIVDETAKALDMVVEKSKIVTDTVVDIATASEDQATAAMQIHTGIDQIAAVVQTNSATAQESAAASEEFNGQAQTLKNLIDRFQLRNDIEIYTENIFGESAVDVEELASEDSMDEEFVPEITFDDDVYADANDTSVDTDDDGAINELLDAGFTSEESDKY